MNFIMLGSMKWGYLINVYFVLGPGIAKKFEKNWQMDAYKMLCVLLTETDKQTFHTSKDIVLE